MKSPRRLFMLLVALSSAVSVGQLRLGPPAPVTPSLTGEGQAQARAVGTASGFFVVWQAGIGRAAKIRAARVRLDGLSLDPQGLTVAEGAGGRFEPAVTFGHGVYFVVWSDLRAGDHAVYGARVAADGTVLDVGGRLLSTAPGARMAGVAATPSGFLVAWAQAAQGGQGTEAWARRLDLAGAPVAEPVALTTARRWTSGEDLGHSVISRAYCQSVRVVAEGSLAFVAWNGNLGDSQDMRVARAVIDTATGAVVGPAAFAIPPTQSRVWASSIAALGDGGVLISWTDNRGRGVLGLPAHNAVVVPLAPSDGGVTLVSFKADGGAREVLAPTVSASGVVAFVQGEANPSSRRTEWRLRVRQVMPGGSSPGDDVTLAEQAAFPNVVMGPTGVTLLCSTNVNVSDPEAGRLVCRVVIP